jgi:predicted GTPase
MTSSTNPTRRRVVILGAAGRDFHNFNVAYREDPRVEVVAFTAAQIPDIDDRRYPPSLSGPNHRSGVPIVREEELEAICRDSAVSEVVFAYSDVPHAHVMHLAARALACGCDFTLLGPDRTSLRSRLPVIAVSAVRTGCGKSQTARWIANRLQEHRMRPAVLRHPMPYGDLAAQAVQRFASREDLGRADCTIEEREEYEPYVEAGGVVYAGVDYQAILERAETEADVILWDGGNNDWPFVAPDLHIVLIDALRPDQVTTHYPGEVVARQADVLVVNKIGAAGEADAQRAIDLARTTNPDARILRANSPVVLDDSDAVRNHRVLVVDDGPTLTHGGMSYGAGFVAAVAAGAKEILDPRRFAAPEIQAVFERFPHLGRVLPAMGYSAAQRLALQKTIEASGADVVVAGTPIDLRAELDLKVRVVRARYSYADADTPGLGDVIDEFANRRAGA